MAEPRNLYDLVDFFRLVIGGTPYYIDEPIGWDAVSISGKRDQELYGFNYEFIDENISLRFPKFQGLELIESRYQQDGGDAEIIFEYGYEQNAVKLVQFRGTLNMNTRRMLDDEIEVAIEKVQFKNLFRTRYETKVAMNAVVDLDGNAVVPPDPVKCRLHSKKIIKASIGVQASDIGTPLIDMPLSNFTLIQPDTTNVTQNEVAEFFGMPFGAVSTPWNDSQYQFKATENGRARLYFNKTFRLVVTSGQALNGWEYGLFIMVKRGATRAFYKEVKLTGSEPGQALSADVNLTIDESVELLVDDEVYFEGSWISDSTDVDLRFLNYVNTVSVKQETVAAASDVFGYKIHDCLSHVIRCITGQSNAMVSGFFGIGGPGEKYILTNGFQIRNFDIANKPVKLSLQDIIQGVNSLWNIGVQYSKDAAGVDIVHVEQFDDLFGDGLIMSLDDVFDYEEQHSKDVTFNEFEVGYEKFAEENLNTLDEFNTVGVYLTPIKTFKNKYIKRSKFIASGYSIEDIRRQQFKANPSTSYSNDDSIFIVAILEDFRIYPSVPFSIVPGPGASSLIALGKSVGFLAGDQFYITGGSGANNGILFTVEAAVDGTEIYKITPVAVNDSGIAEIKGVLSYPAAERNEAFDLVENVFSPDTVYNLRLSPKRILFNHAKYLNAGLAHKEDSDVIRNTSFKNNGLLKTQFNPAEPFKLTDTNLAIREDETFPLSDFNSRSSAFLNENATFKAKISYTNVATLYRCVTGQNFADPSLNYGIIRHPDNVGNTWESVIESMEYQPVTEVLSLVVRKKRIV